MVSHLRVLSEGHPMNTNFKRFANRKPIAFVRLNPDQGLTFPGDQGHMPLDFAMGP